MRTVMIAIATILSVAPLILTGCGRVTAETTAPLYDPARDLQFDPRLLGVWLPDSVLVNLRRGEGNTYLAKAGGLSWLVIFGDAGNKTQQPDPVHLVRIGKYEYFFAAPKPGETGTSLTGCCRVEFADDRITLHGLNLQAVADDLQTHPTALKHEWTPQPRLFGPSTQPATEPSTAPAPATGPASQPAALPTTGPTAGPTTGPTTGPVLMNGDLKITDTPERVRAYLEKHQDEVEFFSDPVVLYRVAK